MKPHQSLKIREFSALQLQKSPLQIQNTLKHRGKYFQGTENVMHLTETHLLDTLGPLKLAACQWWKMSSF